MIADYIARASEIWDIAPAVLTGPRRDRVTAEARMAVYWAAWKTGQYSSGQIGRALNRHHTSVLHGIRKMRTERDPVVLGRMAMLSGIE
jgi:chromosomal replication initiation ATPase DnaA